MAILTICFLAFCAFIALAPKEVTQAFVALTWVIAAAGCAASVAATLVR